MYKYKHKCIECGIKIVILFCVFFFIFRENGFANGNYATELSWSHAGFDEVRYFEEENMLRLRDSANAHSYFFIDLDGNLIETPELESLYLVNEDNPNRVPKNVYDAYGHNLDYIADSDCQEIIGGVSFDDKDWIWIKEVIPSYEATKIYVVAIDAHTYEEVFRIDCSDYIEYSDDYYHIYEFINCNGEYIISFKQPYTGENSFSIDISTGEAFYKKEMFYDGYMRSGDGYKSCNMNDYRGGGYSVICDTHGNPIVSGDKFRNISDSTDMGAYSEGIFFHAQSNAFYDINLNKIIDLSNYNLSLPDDWARTDSLYVFEDGYCELGSLNKDGTYFESLIDRDGNFVIDWTTEAFDYEGAVTETLLHISDGEDWLYNINTQERTAVDTAVFGGVQVGTYIYYIKDGALFCYDILESSSKEIEIKGIDDEDESGTIVGYWRETDSPSIIRYFGDYSEYLVFWQGELRGEGEYYTYIEDENNILVTELHDTEERFKYEIHNNYLVLKYFDEEENETIISFERVDF